MPTWGAALAGRPLIFAPERIFRFHNAAISDRGKYPPVRGAPICSNPGARNERGNEMSEEPSSDEQPPSRPGLLSWIIAGAALIGFILFITLN